MSVNKHRPHLFIVPEDDACRQLANGFLLDPEVNQRQIQIEDVAGGWTQARSHVIEEHSKQLASNPHRHVLLIVDFDQNDSRLGAVLEGIDDSVRSRVFVLGCWGEPEDLKKAKLGSYEKVGRKLAEECRDGEQDVWSHQLLKHNLPELRRLDDALRAAIFPSSFNAISSS